MIHKNQRGVCTGRTAINSFKHVRSPVFEYRNCGGGTALRVGTGFLKRSSLKQERGTRTRMRFQYLHIRKKKEHWRISLKKGSTLVESALHDPYHPTYVRTRRGLFGRRAEFMVFGRRAVRASVFERECIVLFCMCESYPRLGSPCLRSVSEMEGVLRCAIPMPLPRLHP